MVHAYERESVQQIQLEKHTNPVSVKVYCPGWGKGRGGLIVKEKRAERMHSMVEEEELKAHKRRRVDRD